MMKVRYNGESNSNFKHGRIYTELTGYLPPSENVVFLKDDLGIINRYYLLETFEDATRELRNEVIDGILN